MIVGVDATPLLGRRTGIGRYVENLLAAVTDLPPSGVTVRPTAFTLRGLGQLPGALPPGLTPRSRPFPANLLQTLWLHGDRPPVELICGRVDVFHGTNFVLPPMRRARGVVTVHDLAYLRLPDVVEGVTARLRGLVPRGLARADVVCTPSQATADDVAEAYRIPLERLAVTPLGIDPSWFAVPPMQDRLRQRLGLPATYLVAVGTQEPRKGLDVALAALRQVPDAPPLALVGAPGWGPALQTAGLGPGRVIELGYLDTAELQSVVAGATALVFPSLYEGFGLPPLEAAAAGIPSVVSDLPVLREVMGAHARYAEVASADSLADALRTTLTAGGPSPAAVLRAHAAGYTWARCAELTVAAWQRAAAS